MKVRSKYLNDAGNMSQPHKALAVKVDSDLLQRMESILLHDHSFEHLLKFGKIGPFLDNFQGLKRQEKRVDGVAGPHTGDTL